MTLEHGYACPVWNPHQQYLSDKLEKIQRNVSRWILGSSIEFNGRSKYLEWPSLLSRRDFLSIVQLFKFINGFSKVNLHDYLVFTKSRTSQVFSLQLTSINFPFGLGILIHGMTCQII